MFRQRKLNVSVSPATSFCCVKCRKHKRSPGASLFCCGKFLERPPSYLLTASSRTERGRGLTRRPGYEGNKLWLKWHVISWPLTWRWKARKERVRRWCWFRSDVQLLSCWLKDYAEGSSETGFARTWHPAQPHTMRDGLAHKSMPVGNVHLSLM